MDAGCRFIARSRSRSFCRRELQVSIMLAGILMTMILLFANLAATLPNGQNHWIPCAVIDCGVATTLKSAPLQMLKNRKRDSSVTVIDDYYMLNTFNATDLKEMYFDVPKIVHQVWLGEQEPPVAWIDSWRYAYTTSCPGWTHRLWTTANFSMLVHLDTQLLQPEEILSGKADIVRGPVLYEHGGVYIDADTLWVNQHCLDDVMTLASTTGFLTAIEPMEGGCQSRVANGVMAAVRHHPMIREYMQVQHYFTISKGIGVHPWERLGPLALTAAITKANNYNCHGQVDLSLWNSHGKFPAVNVMLATILHPMYFYPKPWHGVTQAIANDSSAVRVVAKEFSNAMMYQFGLTTNFLQTNVAK